jgi:hypothetical protein
MQDAIELQNFLADASFIRDKAPITIGKFKDKIK